MKVGMKSMFSIILLALVSAVDVPDDTKPEEITIIKDDPFKKWELRAPLINPKVEPMPDEQPSKKSSYRSVAPEDEKFPTEPSRPKTGDRVRDSQFSQQFQSLPPDLQKFVEESAQREFQALEKSVELQKEVDRLKIKLLVAALISAALLVISIVMAILLGIMLNKQFQSRKHVNVLTKT